MQKAVSLIIVSGLISLAGCSAEQLKHATYETLQNVKQQECQKDMTSDCEKRESYEVYRDKRDELKPN